MDIISSTAEEMFGIRADPSDAEKLRAYIHKKYGEVNHGNIQKVFMSGEAAGFLTVNETYFFREPVHFEFLREMLPAFEKTGLRICSAAASTGCEAYSIAMLLEAYNRGRERPLPYHIDAFDIDQNAVKTASAGVYGERSMREDGSVFRYLAEPWIERLEHGYRVADSLKENIHFFEHNLMDTLSPEAYHIIFFRNAFIYFSQRVRSRILCNLSGALREGGILIMGVSETAGARHDSLEEKIKGDVFYFTKAKQCCTINKSLT